MKLNYAVYKLSYILKNEKLRKGHKRGYQYTESQELNSFFLEFICKIVLKRSDHMVYHWNIDLKIVQNRYFSKVIFAYNNLEQKILHFDLNFYLLMDWIGCYSYEVKHYKAYSAELREISFKFCIFNELFYLQRSIGSRLERYMNTLNSSSRKELPPCFL